VTPSATMRELRPTYLVAGLEGLPWGLYVTAIVLYQRFSAVP